MLKRIASATLVCAASIALPCFSQNQATFNITTAVTGVPGARSAYSVDVNNDGIPDIISTSAGLPNQVSVDVSNGDGSLKQTFLYQFANQYQGSIPVAYHDFNGDGKLDLLVELSGSNQLAFFAGNGDGTFQAPVFENIALPSGQIFGGEEMVVADFTGDGKPDLVTVANASLLNNLVLIPGSGGGQFGAAKVIYTAPTDHGAGWSLRAGDFDADGKADYAFSESTSCNQGGCTAGTLHVEYGDGAGNFTDTTPYSSSGYVFLFNTADLNNDGKTDIVGTSGAGPAELITLYGQSDRTFHLYTVSTSLSSGSAPVVADFNGDGANDVAWLAGTSSGTTELILALGNNTAGTFSFETISSPLPATTAPIVGDFNRDTKPDLGWLDNASGGAVLVTERNGTSGTFTHGCAYPSSGQGINACTVTGTASSPTLFRATANSFGKIRKLEIWVDGKKIGEQWHDWGDHYTFFNLSASIAAGHHTATYYAADVDNRLQRTDFGFSVGSATACAPPSSTGLNVCSPANNSTVASPVQVTAAAKITGTLARMEVWVDGVKKYTEKTSTHMSTSIALGSGKHRFDLYAVNTAGTKWEKTVYATVK